MDAQSIRGALAPVVAQLRHLSSILRGTVYRPAELGRGLLDPQIRRVESLLVELDDELAANPLPRGSVSVPEEFLDFLRRAPVRSGVCCCGESMEGHSDPMSCGHSPVDMWDHSLDQWLKQIAARPAIAAGTDAGAAGIYTASKTKHAPIWKDYRSRGWPINSTWIDEAGPGESADLADLWDRCIREASTAAVLVVYREADDVLKGGWAEVGAALACGVPVYAVGIEGFTIAKDRRIKHFETLDDAMDAAARLAAFSSRFRAICETPASRALAALCTPALTPETAEAVPVATQPGDNESIKTTAMVRAIQMLSGHLEKFHDNEDETPEKTDIQGIKDHLEGALLTALFASIPDTTQAGTVPEALIYEWTDRSGKTRRDVCLNTPADRIKTVNGQPPRFVANLYTRDTETAALRAELAGAHDRIEGLLSDHAAEKYRADTAEQQLSELRAGGRSHS